MEKKDMILSDDDLNDVTGGTGGRSKKVKSGSQLMKVQCTCGTINIIDVSKSSFECIHCKKLNRIDG